MGADEWCAKVAPRVAAQAGASAQQRADIVAGIHEELGDTD